MQYYSLILKDELSIHWKRYGTKCSQPFRCLHEMEVPGGVEGVFNINPYFTTVVRDGSRCLRSANVRTVRLPNHLRVSRALVLSKRPTLEFTSVIGTLSQLTFKEYTQTQKN